MLKRTCATVAAGNVVLSAVFAMIGAAHLDSGNVAAWPWVGVACCAWPLPLLLLTLMNEYLDREVEEKEGGDHDS